MNKTIKPWPRYSKEVCSWVARGLRAMWPFALLVLIIIVAVSWPLSCFGKPLLWAGTVLQIFGFCILAWVLGGTEKKFGIPSRIKRLKKYFRNFPKRSVPIYLGAGNNIVSPAISSAHVTSSPGPNASLEDRLTRLEKITNELHHEAHNLRNDLKAGIADLNSKLTKENHERTNDKDEIEESIKDTATSAIDAEILAILYFIAGITLTAFPDFHLGPPSFAANLLSEWSICKS